MMTSNSTKPRALNIINTETVTTTIITVELPGEEVVGRAETVSKLMMVECKSSAEDATKV